MKEPKVIIWVDPGGTSGVSVWAQRTDKWYHCQVEDCSKDEQLYLLLMNLVGYMELAVPYSGEDDIILGWETFDFRMEERYRDKIDYTAAEVIGALRMWAYARPNVKVVHAGAGLGKGFWSNEKIKQCSLWVPGQRHAMDARRHLLRYRLFKLQHNSLLDPFKPPPSNIPALDWPEYHNQE